MRERDEIYFSPNYHFLDLKWYDKNNLIAVFKERINFFYFELVKQLKNPNQAFGAGLIYLSIIDLLAKIKTGTKGVGFSFKYCVRTNVLEFDQSDPDCVYHNLAHRFYKELRNCLIHECRIKNAGQFSYRYENDIIRFMANSEMNIMIVNPKLLFFSFKNSFDRMMINTFYNDFERANRGIK